MNLMFLSSLFAASAGWDTGLIVTPIVNANQYQATEQDYLAARLGGVAGFQCRWLQSMISDGHLRSWNHILLDWEPLNFVKV